MRARKTFAAVLIKPSHYDDDGYVIQWIKSGLPSNTLAALHGLIEHEQHKKTLGDDVDIEITSFDETNTIVDVRKLTKIVRAADAGFVGLVGVQSNQFPRAVDIARQFRANDIKVVIGGFHAAGCMAMLPEIPPDIQEAIDLGVSIYAGEAEGRLDEVLLDVWHDRLKPLYNYMQDLPDMEAASIPFLPRAVIDRTAGSYTSFDSGRGCPFQCSFCTIINVQGRKSRYRSPDDIEEIIRRNEAQGIRRYFITDDNFARNKNWEAILDRMIKLKEEEGFRFKFIIQVDTLCHKLPNFVEKSVRAGCNRVFIGLENIDPEALTAAKKRQNKIWEYRKMMQAWKHAGVITYAGYILGFPDDTPEKVKRNIEILKRELPLDLVEFFYLTPLPGSEDHQTLYNKGIWMDPDLNKYDLNNRVSHHPVMSDAEWEKLYFDCWKQYYTPEHVETILRRSVASGHKISKLYLQCVQFYGSVFFEKVHPLEVGVFRRKARRQRRHGMPVENPIPFYAKRVIETLMRAYGWGAFAWKLHRVYRKVRNDPTAKDHQDLALTPVSEEEENNLDLIKVFEDVIPDTYGAPTRKPAAQRSGPKTVISAPAAE